MRISVSATTILSRTALARQGLAVLTLIRRSVYSSDPQFKVGRLAAEAPEDPSGDDAPMLAGELRVGRDRSRRREVEIALDGYNPSEPRAAASSCRLT